MESWIWNKGIGCRDPGDTVRGVWINLFRYSHPRSRVVLTAGLCVHIPNLHGPILFHSLLTSPLLLANESYNPPSPMPAAPKEQLSKKPGAPKAKGAVRAKSGCYTCRIRRKKCDEHQNQDGYCDTCVRLRLQCLGFGAKRPDWLRESHNVSLMRDKIKAFLAAQGMIKGHSGTGPRGSEHDLPILRLEEDNTPSSSESPPTPTLSLSPSEPPRHLQHESAIREQPPTWVGIDYPHMNQMRGNSPFGGSSHSSSHHDIPMYSNPYNPSSNSIVACKTLYPY